jgi:hypothetical protein
VIVRFVDIGGIVYHHCLSTTQTMLWIFTIHTSTLLYTYVLLQILVAGLSRTEERLDSENQVRVEGLSDKVSRLKSVSQVLGLRLTD